MGRNSNKTTRLSGLGAAFVSCAGLIAGAAPAEAEGAAVPLHDHPARAGAIETANTLPNRAFQFYIATMQTDPRVGTGTGNQLYYGGGSYGVSDRLTVGLDFMRYNDPPITPISGSSAEIVTTVLAGSLKYKMFENNGLSVAAQVSAESFLRLESGFWGGRSDNVFVGSLKLPVTYQASPALQFHVTPAVSYFPDTVAGTPFYGTIPSIGAGVSYKPSERFGFHASVEMPIGDGTNSITSAGAYVADPVWRVSGRYNVTPRIAAEAFVTNGIGTTPATSILTHWPSGDDVLVGAQLTWTPGARLPESYRGVPNETTARQRSLQSDGFTFGTPDTLDPGFARIAAWGSGDDAFGGLVSISPDRDGEIQFAVERYANDGSVPAALVPAGGDRFMIGPKLRFMDQNNGDPISLSARALFGRQLSSSSTGAGVFYADVMISRKTNERLTLTASPRLAAFGSTEVAALGIGANFEVMDGFSVIGELSAVGLDASEPTWAVGGRYVVPNTNLGVDLYTTNAIGSFGIGNMLAQSDPRIVLGLSTQIDLNGLALR